MMILVTGCAGFIGFHVTQALLSNGHSVVGVDSLNDYYPTSLKVDRLRQLGITGKIREHRRVDAGNGFIFIKSNIEFKTLFTKQLKPFAFDAVCHLAAQAGVRYSIEHPEHYMSSNMQGFFHILEFCRSRPSMRLVFASSSSVYGKNTSIPYKESDTTDSPVSFYAATKKSNELMAHAYSELYGFEAIGLRFFTVYGAWGRPDMAPLLFTRAILSDEPIRLFNHGNLSRDFTYIDDIVAGICKVLIDPPAVDRSALKRFRVYNIGNSSPVNIKDFISILEAKLGLSARYIDLPMQPGDVKDTWADVSRLKRDYDYSPATPLSSGLEALVEWYLDYYRTLPCIV